MNDHDEESLLAESARGTELVSDLLAYGEPILHPSVASAATTLGTSTRTLARSLQEPRALRTPEAAAQTLAGLHAVLLGAASAVESVGRSVGQSVGAGEATGTWTDRDTQALEAAAGRLRQVLPVLARAAGRAGRLRYAGPPFATETQRTASLVAELRRRGAHVLYDPTVAPDYHETESGGGWRVQFRLPGDDRTLELVTGDIALDLSRLPLHLGARDTHPAIVVDHVAAHPDDFVAGHAVDPSRGESGWIPPHHRPAGRLR